MSFFDFNTADQQQSFDLIPKGTLARVRISIKPGALTTRAKAGLAVGPPSRKTPAPSISPVRAW